MGKIFEALEKAKRPAESQRSSLTGKRKSGVHKSTTDNVVPFNAGRPTPATEDMDQNLIALHKPQSVEAQVFKNLRTNILFPSAGKPPKSILVTSALPGEGKSFVCANLAISIAQGLEDHVLLIDADLRKPTIDNFFGIGQVPGLSEYLVGGEDVSKHFIKTTVQKLTVLPAGKPPHNPTELLTTQKMKALLNEVTRRYDDRHIIIDSAPPSLASETAVVAKYVDGIIMVVRAGKTPRSEITDVIKQLGKEKIVGIVLNHSDQFLKKYYGYGKSYYNPQTR